MNMAPIQAEGLPNPDYSRYCDRDLCIELSKYEAVMEAKRAELVDVDRASSEAREANAPIPEPQKIGRLRVEFLHAVRQITRVREQQHNRSKTNHRARAIKRGKAKR